MDKAKQAAEEKYPYLKDLEVGNAVKRRYDQIMQDKREAFIAGANWQSSNQDGAQGVQWVKGTVRHRAKRIDNGETVEGYLIVEPLVYGSRYFIQTYPANTWEEDVEKHEVYFPTIEFATPSPNQSDRTKSLEAVGQPSDFFRSLGIKFNGKWYSHPATNTYDNMGQVIEELITLIKNPPLAAKRLNEIDTCSPAPINQSIKDDKL